MKNFRTLENRVLTLGKNLVLRIDCLGDLYNKK